MGEGQWKLLDAGRDLTVGCRWRLQPLVSFWGPVCPCEQEQPESQAGVVPGSAGLPQLGRNPALCSCDLCSSKDLHNSVRAVN